MHHLKQVKVWSSYSSVYLQFRFQSGALKGNVSKTEHELQQKPQLKPRAEDFRHAKIGTFFQDRPQLRNQYNTDPLLRSWLLESVSKELFTDIDADLTRFGDRVTQDVLEWHHECERDPPRIQQYDAWGNRIDRIVTCDAWKRMHDLSAREGLIANAYDNKFGAISRVYQLAKLYLFFPSGGLYGCPLAMTDGACKVLSAPHIGKLPFGERMREAYARMTSRDPKWFWTSGQWMTERRGGSDVAGGTETIAVEQPDGSYRLSGYKWFTSATDSNVALTLARPINSRQSEPMSGTRGLSLFYLETRHDNGNLNGIRIERLKDKLGTRQVPTAELLLDNAVAYRISDFGAGVSAISPMLMLTRLHNAIAACSSMRRLVELAKDYSSKRVVFGKRLVDHAIHTRTLAQLEVEARGAFFLVTDAVRLLGQHDFGTLPDEDAANMLRLLTPLAKLYTAKQAVSCCSEALEAFGGLGVLEDTGLPVYLRDAQILPIWEGTTNVLSLDVLRVLAKTRGAALQSFSKAIDAKLASAAKSEPLKVHCETVQRTVRQCCAFAAQHTDQLEVAARDFAYSLSRLYIGAQMLSWAARPNAVDSDILAAVRWCTMQQLAPVLRNNDLKQYDDQQISQERVLLFGE